MRASDDLRNEWKKKTELKGENVIIVDIGMPFWSMVTFMVKAAIAAIPAIIILILIGYIVVRITMYLPDIQ